MLCLWWSSATIGGIYFLLYAQEAKVFHKREIAFIIFLYFYIPCALYQLVADFSQSKMVCNRHLIL